MPTLDPLLALALAVAGLLLGGGGIGGWLSSRSGAHKVAADVWGQMVGDLRSQVDRQQGQITALQQQGDDHQGQMAQMQEVMMQTAHRAQRAETHANSIHDWIDRGMDPPPPTRPVWLPPSANTPSSIIQPPRPPRKD